MRSKVSRIIKHKSKITKRRNKSRRYHKRGGTKKTVRSIRKIDNIKSNAKNTMTFTRTSVPQKYGSKGNDLRQQLIDFCRANDKEGYEALTNQIIEDYYKNEDKSIFIHLKNNYFKKEDKNGNIIINGFRIPTKLCLYYFLHRAQEEAIPESMEYLEDIMYLRNEHGIRGLGLEWHDKLLNV